MKRMIIFLSVFSLLWAMTGCSREPWTDIPPTQTAVNTPSIAETAQETTEPAISETTQAVTEPEAPETTEAVTEPTVPPTTEAETLPAADHSELYIEGYTAEQIADFFCEVVLDTEYATGEGNFTLVQKWDAPIRYSIYGDPTDEDLAVLTGLFDGLNAIEGFPGIQSAEEWGYPALCIYFQAREDFNASFGSSIGYEDADGATEYWYFNDSNLIYEGWVAYRTDIDQLTRNSVLLEEIVNVLGLGDTVLRQDSIVYQGYSQPQELSQVDWLILKLLYHPRMERGMDASACRAVIAELYY